jgi:sucrose-6-phosphate hydrolase SacC (GH32 family)
MPFNQQMSFPCRLTLRTFPEGIRLCREPVKEVETIHGEAHKWSNAVLKPGENLLSGISGELFDIRAEIEPRGAAEVGFKFRGIPIQYNVKDRTLSSLGKSAPLEPEAGRLKLQILVDRTSIEIFGNDGKITMASCFIPDLENKSLEIYAAGGSSNIVSLTVYELRSAWQNP